MIELVNPTTPHEFGDAALVNRNGSPAMVQVGDIISHDTSEFVTSNDISEFVTQATLDPINTDLDVLSGASPVAPAGGVFTSNGAGGGSFIRTKGFGQYADSRITAGAPSQTIATGVRTQWINNKLASVVERLPSDATTPFWNSTTNRITPIASFDTYTIRCFFNVSGYTGTTPYIYAELDIGGTIGDIYSQTFPLLKGGVEQSISFSLPVYTGSTFLANGGAIYLTYTGTGSATIYGSTLLVRRDSKNYV